MAAALAALGIAGATAAQTYPSRPIRLVVAQSTGGNADFVARAFAQRLWLRDRLAADGSEALGSTPKELAAHLAAELARYSKLIKAIGLKVG